MLLQDRACLVTGASRGIGAAIVERFVAQGAVVYANARAEGSLDTVCAALSSSSPGTALPLYFDVTDTAALKDAVMRIKKEQGRLDVLVNNAGIMKGGLIGMIDRASVEETFALNVYATIEALQFAAKLMMRQKAGSIINLASIVGTNGSAGQLAYSASKGAVIALTKAAAKELAPYNVRVNALAPGMIDTSLFRSIGEEAVTRTIESIGLGRVGAPEEVADACVFLASDLSRYVTGQVLGVDGAAVL